MRKKLLTLASAIALFSNVSMVKAAEDISYGISLNGGASMMGGAKFKKTATSKEQEAKKWEMNGAVGFFFGYNFTEMIGMETTLGFRFMNPTNTEAGASSDKDTKTGTTADKSALAIDAKGAYLELLCKIMPVQFDGGYMFINAGLGLDYVMMKSVTIEGKEGKDDAEKKKYAAIVKDLNIDGVFKIGASFLDEVLSASADFKYTVLDQANSDEVKKITEIKDATLNLGAGKLKVGATIGLNIAALMN